ARAAAAAAERGAPPLLDLLVGHAEPDPAQARSGHQGTVERQREHDREGEQRHGRTIENAAVDVFNLFAEHVWENEQERDGYRHRATRIGAPRGAERLGASLYELPPGESTWPYHYEHGAEEWLLVVAGRPTLRTPDGERQLEPGDVAVFREGPGGAHKVTNTTDEIVRVVIFSSKRPLGVAGYPDSRKLGIWTKDDGYIGIVPDEPKLDYWDGE